MLNKENQKNHPFGLSEPRFHYIETSTGISNGNDIKKRNKKINNNIKDNLEGGIGKFLSRENKIENDIKVRPNTSRNNINNFYKNLNTNRVIHPNLNNEETKQIRKRINNSMEKYINKNNGNIFSLLNKTPLSFPIRGKKRVNSSFDNKNGVDIFSKDFLYDNKFNHLLGNGGKLHLSVYANKETESKDIFSSGRKHFKTKMNI
jgi:hypothetical protein